MTQTELSNLFSSTCSLGDWVLLVSPSDFFRLKGITIEKSRLFLLVCQGSLSVTINDKNFELTQGLVDLLDTSTLLVGSCSNDLEAWALFATFEFASASLKNLRPGPMIHPQERLNIPIMDFTEKETTLMQRQLQQLKEILADKNHYYQREMAELYFRSFNLELGNALYRHLKEADDAPKYISRRDFVTLNFFKLVNEHAVREHRLNFYAQTLCISEKHLTRIIKETTGKTPYFFICQEIVHHAMALLEDNKISIGEIADTLNFSDQAAFCKFFKKQKTVSPLAYRRRYE